MLGRMPKMKWRDEVVLVTGASSGIGMELARQLAQRGARLVLVARSESKLRTLAHELAASSGHEPLVLVADLALPGEVARVVHELQVQQLRVEHLINNAGVGYAKPVAQADVETMVRMVHLNCLALTELTNRLLPSMVENRSGGILQVASMVALYPSPYMAAYAASKAYVKSFTEALAVELVGSGVTTSALCPGQVPTGFQQAAGFAESEMSVPGTLSAKETARLGLAGYERGRVVVVPGVLNQISAFFMTLLPRSWVARISAGVLRKLGRFD